MATSSSDAAEPEELQGEPRWSSIRYAPHPRPAQWQRATDEKLVRLVTQSTASGERFPVGVNCTLYALQLPALVSVLTPVFCGSDALVAAGIGLMIAGLEVSRVVRRSPVDCVKRYAFLHDARERYDALEGERQVEVKAEEEEEAGALEDELEGALLDSEDDYLDEQVLSDFATPVASPKLQALDTSGEFVGSGPASPGSPPPFAVVRPAVRQTGGTGGSPFRWESLVNDPNYTAPVLNSPPSLRHKQSFQDRFGLEDDEAKALSSAPSPRLSPRGFMSPPRSQDQIGEMGADPNYSASVLTHAFKGLKLGAMPLGSPPLGSPLIGSPRLSRKISNSEYPFLKEEDISARQSAVSSASSSFRGLGGVEATAGAAPVLNDAYGTADATAGDLQRQMNAHLMRMSAMSTMSSFHGDNPFSGSVTQSALEDAFLDMAGSRLDASNVLLSSRMSVAPGSQSHLHLEQIQALEQERLRAQHAASKPPE